MPSPSTLTLIQPAAVHAISAWTVDAARMALDEHESGSFASSAVLVDAFGRDDRISGCLGKRVDAIASKRGLPFECVPSDEDARRGTAIAKKCQALWWYTHSEATLRRIIRDVITLGVFVGRIAWLKDGAQWKPLLIPYHAANLRWDASTARWMYRTTTIEVVVTPGDGGWFLYTPAGTLDPWMAGGVRALAMPFVMRGFAWRDWARWSEKHGLPTLLAKTVPNDPAGRKAFLTKLANISRETTIELPQSDDGTGYDLTQLEVSDSAAGFRELLERIEVCVAVYLLGQNLTTEVQGGSYAAADIHATVEGGKLSADAEGLSTALRDQVWKWWALYNYGNADLAPWGVWDTAPPEDQKTKAETYKLFADSVKALGDTGIPIDRKALAESFGIPVLSDQSVQDTGQIFEYHYKYGLITVNEGRARLGLPPVPGGDELIKSTPDPAPGEDGGAPANDNAEATPTVHSLATRTTTGLHNGQAAVDDVAGKAIGTAANALAPDVAALLAAIEGATDFDDVKARIAVAYAGMTATRLAALTEKAIVLSRLAGRVAVLEDL